LRYWLCPSLLSAHPFMEAGFKASTLIRVSYVPFLIPSPFE
jgi:hypothetical protein